MRHFSEECLHEGIESIIGQFMIFEQLQCLNDLFVFKSALLVHLLGQSRIDIFGLVIDLVYATVDQLFELIEHQSECLLLLQ